ncbi:MAG TPA: hypothetical protein PLY93_13740, partial [Turneriella sp.]|nr:hypothetical protein [Turneriella sp.]
KAQANKYIFDFGNEFSLQGVFVPLSAGEYALFVTGTSAEAVNLKELSENLLPLGIRKVERVSHASFEQISAGAIDMSI